MPPIRRAARIKENRADPLARSGQHPTFICIPCSEEIRGFPAATILQNDICQDCFDIGYRPQFEAYLKNENSPVLWAGRIVSIDAVQHQFSSAFVQKYRERMQEYAVRPAQRLYCSFKFFLEHKLDWQCTAFLGEKTSYKASRLCLDCGQKSCTLCSSSLFDTSLADHICTPFQKADDGTTTEGDPFQDLQRGIDWQACPGCSTPVYLGEACNHMTCGLTSCKTHFCYLCGAGTRPRDGAHHWALGKPCPLYGSTKTIERRLMEIDYLELDRIRQKARRFGAKVRLPYWFGIAKVVCETLRIMIAIYVLRVEGKILEQYGQLEQIVNKSITENEAWPIVERTFPQLAVIARTCNMANRGDWDDLRGQLEQRLGRTQA